MVVDGASVVGVLLRVERLLVLLVLLLVVVTFVVTLLLVMLSTQTTDCVIRFFDDQHMVSILIQNLACRFHGEF